MAQEYQIGPGVAGAQGYGQLTGPELDRYLHQVQIYTQENIYFGSILDQIATSPVIRNTTGPGRGSTIRFKSMNSIGIHPMDNNGKFKLDDVNVNWREIVLGEMWGWHFKLSKKDMMWEPTFINELITEQMRGVARSAQTTLESVIVRKMIDEASPHNSGHAAGLLDKCTNLGTKEEPLELTPDNLPQFILDLHYVGFQMGLAEEQMFAAMPPFMRTLISRANLLCDAGKTGLPRSSLLMAPDAVAREMTAMNILYSYCLPDCPPAETGLDKTVYPIVFGSPSATGYAVYAESMDIIDKTKGEDSVYFQGTLCTGSAVLEDCLLGKAYVTIDKKLLSAFPYEPVPAAPPPAGP